MGNQTSQTNNFQKEFYQLQNEMKNQRKQFIDFQKVQQEIYNAQMKMQTMRTQQPQNHYNQNQHQYQNQNNFNQNKEQPMNDKIAILLSNPELKSQIKDNPSFGVQMIELILKEFGTQLSQLQYNKINNYLENVSQQASQQQSQQQLTNQVLHQTKQQYHQQQLTNQSHQQNHQQYNRQNQQNQLQLHPKYMNIYLFIQIYILYE